MRTLGIPFCLALAALALAWTAPATPAQRRRGRNPAFSVHWNTLAALPPTKAEDETAAQGEAGEKGKTPVKRKKEKIPLFPKPILVYLTSVDPKDRKNQDYIRQIVFRDARIGLGSHFFLCVQGDGASLPSDPVWQKLLKGKRLPRFVVISRDRRVVVRLEGHIKSSNLLAAMRKVAQWDYKSSFNHYISELRKTLIQLGALRKTAKFLESVQHSGRKIKPPQMKNLLKSRKKVKALIEKLEAKEKKLRDLKLKKKRSV